MTNNVKDCQRTSLNDTHTSDHGDTLTLEKSVPRTIDYDRVVQLGRELLEALGEDPEREGLRDTPRRWANHWREFMEYDPGVIDTTFETTSSGGLVVVSGMRVWSICEHHLLPFHCDVSIGYVVHGRAIGLSKFARIAHNVAHRLQLQEHITEQIADAVSELAGSPDVIVSASGMHLCMVMRGIQTEGVMSSIIARGVFANDVARRTEFSTFITKR